MYQHVQMVQQKYKINSHVLSSIERKGTKTNTEEIGAWPAGINTISSTDSMVQFVCTYIKCEHVNHKVKSWKFTEAWYLNRPIFNEMWRDCVQIWKKPVTCGWNQHKSFTNLKIHTLTFVYVQWQVFILCAPTYRGVMGKSLMETKTY